MPLSASEAESLIDEATLPGYNEVRAGAVSRLPRASRLVGESFLPGARSWDVPHEDAVALGALRERDRVQVFSALCDGLGPDVEQFWKAGQRWPYQAGWFRRAFRAPHDPDVTLGTRMASVRLLLSELMRLKPGRDAEWLAVHAGYLTRWAHSYEVGQLLATVIDASGPEGDRVLDCLVATARGEHEVAVMGRHVVSGLLVCERPDAWDVVVDLLVEARGAEGVRQVVLEAADLAHPDAFIRILGAVLEHGLLRYSGTVRAALTWFTTELVTDGEQLRHALEFVHWLMQQPASERTVEMDDGALRAYLKLWCEAFDDAPAACRMAEPLSREGGTGVRFAAVVLASTSRLTTSIPILANAIDDRNLLVAARAIGDALDLSDESAWPVDTFDRLVRLLDRVNDKQLALDATYELPVEQIIHRREIARAAVRHVGTRDPEQLLPLLEHLDPQGRVHAVHAMRCSGSRAVREALIGLTKDRSTVVRKAAISALASQQVPRRDLEQLDSLLGSKAEETRHGIVQLILLEDDDFAFARAAALVADKIRERRISGVAIIEGLRKGQRAGERLDVLVEGLIQRGETRPEFTPLLPAGKAGPPATLEDALGLVDPEGLTPPPEHLRDTGIELFSESAVRFAAALDQCIEQHVDRRIEMPDWDGTPRVLSLAEGSLSRPFASRGPNLGASEFELGDRVPQLWDVWTQFWSDHHPKDVRDVLRALNIPHACNGWYVRGYPIVGTPAAEHATPRGTSLPRLAWPDRVSELLEWYAAKFATSGMIDFVLDAAAAQLVRLPRTRPASVPAESRPAAAWWEHGWISWLHSARMLRSTRRDLFSQEQRLRLWQLERSLEAGLPGARPNGRDGPTERSLVGRLLRGPWGDGEGELLDDQVRAPLYAVFNAHDDGVATDDDIHFRLIGRSPTEAADHRRLSDLWYVAFNFRDLRRTRPAIADLVLMAQHRIVQVELAGSASGTAASTAVHGVHHAGGSDILLRALRQLGPDAFLRETSGDSRRHRLSRIIRVCFPTGADRRPDGPFATAARRAALPEQRLVELAVFAPHWASCVEATLGWPGLASSVWWLHAHTRDDSWNMFAELKRLGGAELHERTPLTSNQLEEGNVDVEWFQRAHAELGDVRWEKVSKAVKFASSRTGHARARLFADAMRGRETVDILLERVHRSRDRDRVRALGLVPLPPDDRDRETETARRYALLTEFQRGSREFGAQRRASEKLAVEIALGNLARSAGYPDATRMQWAVEGAEVAEVLATSKVEADGYRLELSVDGHGDPALLVQKEARTLKSVPASLRSRAEVKALRSRVKELRRNAREIRSSLELAMVRGEVMSRKELLGLLEHPLLAPQLRRLVLVTEHGDLGFLADHDPGSLVTPPGGRVKIPAQGARIAHPTDLAPTGHWPATQRHVVEHEIVQPFKQVFRELYVPTAEEQRARESTRYAGHQLDPRKALALFGARGWVASHEEGSGRMWHRERVHASVWTSIDLFTPLEVEPPVLDAVLFSNMDTAERIQLAEVPPRIFSETMRDLDLVVSVAHAGGADPEASESTVAMRAALVHETASMLKLENVDVVGPRALIDGKLADYAVHLGSATVHKRPGTAISIVAVPGQHRGRLFLPFRDDDPRSAEVLAKVVLLARDDKIKDPSILEQITHVS